MNQFSKIFAPEAQKIWDFSQFFRPKVGNFSQKVTPPFRPVTPPTAPLISIIAINLPLIMIHIQ